MGSKEDQLYSRLNARGRKSFKPVSNKQLTENFPEYAKLGLPAHKAALDGDIDALKEIYTAFITEGVPSRDVNGATPLHLAVRGNRVEAIKWLLRFTDLLPTMAAKLGETPCHVGAVLGHSECLKVMLSLDIKGHVSVTCDNSGFTALHLAIVKSRNEAAKLLINELGAKGVAAANESGITAAHVAASSGNTEVLKILSSKYKKLLSQQAADHTTPIYFAAQEGKLAALRFLHEKVKCDLSSPSNDGRKPIHAACQCGHTNIVKYIVSQSNNAAIFETAPDGATPLHFAASSGQLKTVQWLIDSDVGGTLVNTKDLSGDIPAHDAAENGQTQTLKLLLESGADLYSINNDGNTPYSLALNSGNKDLVDFVMEYASTMPQKRDSGPSQMTIFDMKGEADIVDFGPGMAGPSAKKSTEVQIEQEEADEVEEVMQIPDDGKKEDKKSKKKKQKNKKGKKKANANSFLSSPVSGAALLSLPSGENSEEDTSKQQRDDKVLDMTKELEMFKGKPKQQQKEGSMVKNAPRVSSEKDETVVRYDEGDITPPVKSKLSHSYPPLEPVATVDYSTVAEIAQQEEKKEKKKGRKNAKSLQKANMKEEPAKNIKRAGDILAGPVLGFKPQFHSNPLQQLSEIPSTPPPTPQTASSTTSVSEAPQTNKATDEDEHELPYDMYIKPEAEKLHKKVEKAPKEDLVLTDLDNEDVVEEKDMQNMKKPDALEKTPHAEDSKLSSHEIDSSGEKPTVSEDASKRLATKWPPSASSESDFKSRDKFLPVNKHSTPPSSLADKSGEKKIQIHLRPVERVGVQKSPEYKGMELEHIKLKKAIKPGERVGEQKVQEHKGMELEHIKLKKATTPGEKIEEKKSQDHKEMELEHIKLKKATKKASSEYSSPSSEATSGADNELMAVLKRRQIQV